MLLSPLLAFLALVAPSEALTPLRNSVRTPKHVVRLPNPPVMGPLTVAPLAAACAVPTLLGYWKSEYGVSYAYGSAMLGTGALVLASSPATRIASAHAACVALYGLRLNLFLLWRELNIPRFREFRDKIEARAVDRGGRLSRTPFIVSCSLLYLGMAAPMVLSAPAQNLGAAALPLISVMFAGLLTAAIGDFWKSWQKGKLGADALVTTGPFALLRHPNYTGEFFLWTGNAALGISAAVASNTLRASVGWVIGSLFGAAGICFVLMQAATGLERRQAEKYADNTAYQAWTSSTWAGPTLSSK